MMHTRKRVSRLASELYQCQHNGHADLSANRDEDKAIGHHRWQTYEAETYKRIHAHQRRKLALECHRLELFAQINGVFLQGPYLKCSVSAKHMFLVVWSAF